jgi:hypothetical protein
MSFSRKTGRATQTSRFWGYLKLLAASSSCRGRELAKTDSGPVPSISPSSLASVADFGGCPVPSSIVWHRAALDGSSRCVSVLPEAVRHQPRVAQAPILLAFPPLKTRATACCWYRTRIAWGKPCLR